MICLQSCKQMESALSKNGAFNQGDISVLKEAVAILQHHDGVSGTAKQHVTDVLFNCHYNQFYDKQSRFNIPYVNCRITLDCFTWVLRSVREFKALITSKFNAKWIRYNPESILKIL